MDEQYSFSIWVLGQKVQEMRRSGADLYRSPSIEADSELKSLSIEIIKRRPVAYLVWVAKASWKGITVMLSETHSIFVSLFVCALAGAAVISSYIFSSNPAPFAWNSLENDRRITYFLVVAAGLFLPANLLIIAAFSQTTLIRVMLPTASLLALIPLGLSLPLFRSLLIQTKDHTKA
jgi:hypothetical protein